MNIITPTKLSELPHTTMISRSPLTYDEAEGWARGLGANVLYLWPVKPGFFMALIISRPVPMTRAEYTAEWDVEDILRREG
jgi:hypothetical protein